MRIKVILTGLIVSALAAIPVLAVTTNNTQKPRATAVVFYDSEAVPHNTYINWVGKPIRWILGFGNQFNELDENFVALGVRIDAPASQSAQGFQFDFTASTNEFPYVEVWGVLPGATAPTLLVGRPLFDLPSGFQLTTLNNNFTRLTFNASQNPDFPAGTTFSSIYYADFAFEEGDVFADQVTNAFVNERPVTGNFQPRPEFDSTLDFNF